MAGDRRPPPRTLNVQRFADARSAELESLYAVVAERVGSDFRVPRQRRRRTSSFVNRRNPNCRPKSKNRKRQLGHISGEDGRKTDSEAAKEGEKRNRRVRRRLEFKGNPISGFSVSVDGTKRLRTHLWHAKRFQMVKQWGFYLPLGLSGRGKGSRSILKQLKRGSLIHDASYFSAVQLEGAEESLITVLDEVLVPSPSTIPEDFLKPIMYGASYGQSMLYRAGADSRAIAPVTYMWRPLIHTSIPASIENVAGGVYDSQDGKKQRQLWIWLHAASFKEGFDVLEAACGAQMHGKNVSVNCVSREGELGRLELIGSDAFKICHKLLKPVTKACDGLGRPKLKSSDIEAEHMNSIFSRPFVMKHAEHLASHAVLSLTVLDPRVVPVNDTKCSLAGPQADPMVQNVSLEETNTSCSDAMTNKLEAFTSTRLEHEENLLALSYSEELWELNTEALSPPMEESLLCTEKHQRRLSFFCIDEAKQEIYTAENTNSFSRSCPILLLRNSQRNIPFLWWSIILPLSWVKAFWISLVSHGARAIGLRERRWIACDAKLPSFPYDFPDCKAYEDHMASEAVASDKKAAARPPSKRPMRVPTLPPWNCIKLHRDGELQTQSKEMAPSTLTGVNGELQLNLAFQGLIARTSGSLFRYLKDIQGGGMMLCPDTTMEKSSFAWLADEANAGCITNGANCTPVGKKCCFVRTILHAHKGVFEEGAIVCAPTYNDYSLWSSSYKPDEQERMQIPSTLVRSYFTQQSLGKWEIQVPEDPATRQFHRQLIGFVTTKFVRGSVKPAAQALCEAALLAQLSKEQQEHKGEVRNQIMVLVRNPRSIVYRRGLATIVLEQQSDDLFFM